MLLKRKFKGSVGILGFMWLNTANPVSVSELPPTISSIKPTQSVNQVMHSLRLTHLPRAKCI